MKRIGLVGGLGPESTLDYYRLIIQAFRERRSPDYPEIVVYSANLTEGLKLMEARQPEPLVDWLLHKIEALHRAGAELAAICSNSPHVVFDEVQRRSPLPLVSIVEAARDEAATRGSQRPGLLGTAFTMQADFYPETFRNRGMQMVVPPAEDQALIHRKLFSRDRARDLQGRDARPAAGRRRAHDPTRRDRCARPGVHRTAADPDQGRVRDPLPQHHGGSRRRDRVRIRRVKTGVCGP